MNKKNNLIRNIVIALFIGLGLGMLKFNLTSNSVDNLFVSALSVIPIFGTLFISALKAIAPILVFVLIIASLANKKKGGGNKIGSVVKLYLIATFSAALIAVIISYIFPVTLTLDVPPSTGDAPESVIDVLSNVILSVVDNPVNALVSANYLGVLFWAVLFGSGLNKASETTKTILNDIANSVSSVVKIVISFAPLGIFGLVFSSVATDGLAVLLDYGMIIFLLLLAMSTMVFIINPLITFLYTKQNPYPLIFKVLRGSAITAFFTRSSAANIPINLQLCDDEGVDPDMYNVSIPLGSTINMSGAAITITTLTLATAHTVGIDVTFLMALLLSILAAVSACGASGVAGGSLLLVPLACSLFGIDQDIAMQVVAIGFIIGVIQDSCETALNSSSDALYTIIVDKRDKLLNKND